MWPFAQIRELEDEIVELEMTNARLNVEKGQLLNSTVRFSLKTELGIKPIYQSNLQMAFLATILAGGNGLDMGQDTTLEIISDWKPSNYEGENDADN